MAKMTDETLREITDWLNICSRQDAWKYRPKSSLSLYHSHCWDLLTEVRRLRRYEELLDIWFLSGLPPVLTSMLALLKDQRSTHAVARVALQHLRDRVDNPSPRELASPADVSTARKAAWTEAAAGVSDPLACQTCQHWCRKKEPAEPAVLVEAALKARIRQVIEKIRPSMATHFAIRFPQLAPIDVEPRGDVVWVDVVAFGDLVHWELKPGRAAFALGEVDLPDSAIEHRIRLAVTKFAEGVTRALVGQLLPKGISDDDEK